MTRPGDRGASRDRPEGQAKVVRRVSAAVEVGGREPREEHREPGRAIIRRKEAVGWPLKRLETKMVRDSG